MTERGWQRIGPDPQLAAWAAAALPLAVAALHGQPRRAGGTWAVGLDLLANDAEGAVAGVPLPWEVLGLTPQPLHAAQLSAVYPGYPQPDDAETAVAQRFRLTRDAAHLDGLLPLGPDRQRRLLEPHGWILGLPLTLCDPSASPLVVWEGSHLMLLAAFRAALRPYPTDRWQDADLTEVYTQTRAQIFRDCRRVELAAVPGEALLLHRACLHGVAPWAAGAAAPDEGRIIAYFRPLLPSVAEWVLHD